MDDELREELYIYRLLSQLFLTEPAIDLLEDLGRVRLPEENDDAIGRGLRLLSETARQNASRLADWQEELAVEYSRLFIGPRAPVAIPFASCYLSETKSLMTDETIEVRKKYLENGLAVQNLYSIPDDHIGIELEFLVHLTGEALAAAGEEEKVKEIIKVRDDFMTGHFLLWAPFFADQMLTAANEDFYRGTASLLLGIMCETVSS